MSIESKADAIRPLKRRHTVDGISTKIYVLMDKWIVRLGLAHWAIKVRFDYSGDGYAEMVCEDPEYEVATIWVNVRRCRRELWTEAQYDSIILHELVHIEAAKMTELLPNTRESEKLEESFTVGMTEALLLAEEEGS